MSLDPDTSSPRAARTHRFVVQRDEEDPGVWLAAWVDDERVHTFGRGLAEVEAMARDALALWMHVDPEDVDVVLDVALGDELAAAIDALSQLRGELASVQATVTSRQRELARHLVQNEGMTYRDAARLLGVSHQRIAQLVRETA